MAWCNFPNEHVAWRKDAIAGERTDRPRMDDQGTASGAVEETGKRWQFSLHNLLVFIGVVAVCCGLIRFAWPVASELELETDVVIYFSIPFDFGIMAGVFARLNGATKTSSVLWGIVVAILFGVLIALNIPVIA